ncbi:hypothetical protein LP415_10255 [Polaromonas sp. P1(28)-8]|nr:hypothetical protein LP415_10255 [Polaromonas sp. P1(28)-8]
MEQLLSNLGIKSFVIRDEQEVAGYAELMDLVFSSWQDIPFTENHITQLHQILLRYSPGLSAPAPWDPGNPGGRPRDAVGDAEMRSPWVGYTSLGFRSVPHQAVSGVAARRQ